MIFFDEWKVIGIQTRDRNTFKNYLWQDHPISYQYQSTEAISSDVPMVTEAKLRKDSNDSCLMWEIGTKQYSKLLQTE